MAEEVEKQEALRTTDYNDIVKMTSANQKIATKLELELISLHTILLKEQRIVALIV